MAVIQTDETTVQLSIDVLLTSTFMLKLTDLLNVHVHADVLMVLIFS